MKNMNQQGFAHQALILVLVVLAGVGGAGLYVYQKQNSKEDNKATTQTTVKKEEKKDDDTDVEEEYIPPEGWKKYSDSETEISFYFPADLDHVGDEYPPQSVKRTFSVTAAPLEESFQAPYGGMGGGVRYFFSTEKKKWYITEPDWDTEGKMVPGSDFKNGKEITSLTNAVSSQTDYPVLYGQTGEGGGVSYLILIANKTDAFQIVLPTIAETLESEYEKTINLYKTSVPKIIESIRFTE